MHGSTRQSAVSNPFQIARSNRDPRTLGVGAMTIIDDDALTRLEFDVPGFSSDDIAIELEDGQLVVSGEISRTETKGTAVYSERRSSTFRRVIRLDSKLDPSTAEAELSDGVLKLSFTRKPEAERRRIEIRPASAEV
jgi:HSP20 family protein